MAQPPFVRPSFILGFVLCSRGQEGRGGDEGVRVRKMSKKVRAGVTMVGIRVISCIFATIVL